jgi:aryl-alcohol dehydrogenase-like predicted oxidoreductase
MEKRRLGRLERMNSVLIYGGAALARVDQDEADRSIAQALDAGINHFDVAANYGDAELRYGPWMAEIRDRIFLSTKTEQRSKDEARREMERSLERLRVEYVDLIQLHAINDLEQLDLATGHKGSLEAAMEARDEGLVGAIGITGHGHGAPATHLEALRRFPFQTVLTPLNYLLYGDPSYRADYDALVEEIKRQDAGLMIIKAIARGLWRKDEEQRYETWYEPFEQQEHIDAAVAFVLGRSEVTGLCVAGDTRLLPAMIRAESRSRGDSRMDALAGMEDYASPFVPAPGRVGPL